MLVIRRLFGTGTICIAPSGVPLLLCLLPGLAPWAFLSRPCGASFATGTKLYKQPETTPERDLRADLAPRAYPYRPREHVCRGRHVIDSDGPLPAHRRRLMARARRTRADAPFDRCADARRRFVQRAAREAARGAPAGVAVPPARDR